MNEQLAPLPAGTQAPTFTLRRTGNEVFLLQDACRRPVVLVFYPGDWEPVSDAQLTLYQAYLPEFDRLGAVLVGISVDSVWSHLAFARARGVRFSLLADFAPKGAVARAYGVYREADAISARALFVVDGAGTIRWSRAYPANLNPGVDGILTALEALHEEP